MTLTLPTVPGLAEWIRTLPRLGGRRRARALVNCRESPGRVEECPSQGEEMGSGGMGVVYRARIDPKKRNLGLCP